MFQRYSQSNASVAAGPGAGEQLSEAELGAVMGGQTPPPNPIEAGKEAVRSWGEHIAPIFTPVEKTVDFVVQIGNWVRYQAEYVPSLGLSEREIDGYQARLEEAREQSEKAEAEERERLISGDKETTKEEVRDYLNTIDGSGGAPPANAQPQSGGETAPSFPTNMVNVPPPHQPQIVTEQVGGATYNTEGQVGRLY